MLIQASLYSRSSTLFCGVLRQALHALYMLWRLFNRHAATKSIRWRFDFACDHIGVIR